MDPYVQAAFIALVAGAALVASFFVVMSILPADPPPKEPPATPAE
jgi:hypothetical protein